MRLSPRIAFKATVVTAISMMVSVTICLVVVPLLGGTPDGPGFWMSLWCPMAIAWPCSAFQFSQTEKIRQARDALTKAHAELARVHEELMQAHATLEKKARIDGLTGGLNRDTFLALFETAAAQPRRSALLLADADHFKRINDTFGHPGGDEALRAIAATIAKTVRPLDFWGRVGGEEFAIFLEDVDEGEAFYIAERIRMNVADLRVHHEGAVIRASLSIGVTLFDGGEAAKAHFSAADRRLYRAKSSGRNRVIMTDDPDTEAA